MLRLYVRIKTKYDPAKANDELLFVDAQPTTTIGRVKEEAKRKATGSKIDSLYFRREDGSYGSLADDRLIGYYNIQNRTVLETTSNPFWAAAIYARLNEVKNQAAENPDDVATVEGAQKSAICRYMALGILFNGSNREGNQPPYFESLTDLCNHLMTAGKKPAYMSQTTRNILQAMKEDFILYDQHTEDPVGHFIHRQAVRLGFVIENDRNGMRMPDGVDDDDERFAERGYNGGGGIRNLAENRLDRRQNGRENIPQQNRQGRRRQRAAAAPEQICQYCDESVAVLYCAECQPPLLLCNQCARDLHARDRRRNHNLQDVSEGPAPARGTTYHPQPYRAPFAMLVAFYRALREVPQRMSLSADELKVRAQPLTGTDLEDKQGAKRFSGFDSLEKTLIKHDLVVKMAAQPPRYSLLEMGENLASRCSEFDYAVQSHRQCESVPVVPIAGVRPVFQHRQICLLVDSDEPLKDRFIRVVKQMGLAVKMRKLPVGDFAWILLPPGVNPDTARDMPEQELVLPYLVERKTWGDLWASSKTNRFLSQVQRMKACGLANLFYLVEGSPKDIYGNPGVEVQNYLQNLVDKLMLEDKFLLNRTGSWLKTVQWLCHLTNMASEKLNKGPNPELMTFSEFNKAGRKRHDGRAFMRNTPVKSVVWKASEFADIIERCFYHNCRHHHDNISLTNATGLTGRPVDDQPPNFLLFIQGLTAYNTRCHSLFNKALADLLKNPAQGAEECIQRHLHGLTSQLIDQDVFQYYILWLQVFKGVMVRRTEADQETLAIRAMTEPASTVEHAATLTRVTQERLDQLEQTHNVPVTGSSVAENFVFANDSQEEELMLQQALTQSGNGTNIVQTKKDDLTEEEQLKLALEISKADFNTSQSMIGPGLSEQISTRIHNPPLQLVQTSPRKPRDNVEKCLPLSLSSEESLNNSRSAQKDPCQRPWEALKDGSVSGTCSEDAIFVESQELDTDLPEVLEVQTTSSDKCRALAQESCEDDYALALKIHEELNKSSGHEVSHTEQDDVEIVVTQRFLDSSRDKAKTANGLQSEGEGSKTDDDDDLAFALEVQKQLDKEATNSIVKPRAGRSQLSADHDEDDLAYALKLQKELNNEKPPLVSPRRAQTTETADDQLSAYRERQRQKFGARPSSKTNKHSPGLVFRRNVEAIAAGKRLQVGIANPVARHSPKSGNPTSQKLGSVDDEQFRCQQSTPSKKYMPESPSASCSSTGKATLVFPTDRTSLPSACCPGSTLDSPSIEKRQDTGTLSLPGCSSSTASPSKESSQRNDSWLSSSPRAGPKCGACGNIGHSRSSTKCPQYYSLESRLKREERARKRKAEKEAEERELQDSLGNLAAQRINLENQAAVLGQQLQALQRQSSDLANTHKLVEDALGGKKRKRRLQISQYQSSYSF